MTLRKIAAAIVLFALAASAHATTLTYHLTAPTFTYYADGVFTEDDGITGYFSFDDSKLDGGNGTITTSVYGINPGVKWSFSDGYNTFNDDITKTSFIIQMSFKDFAPVYWNIDTTFGYTVRDIFVESSGYNESYFDGSHAVGAPTDASSWTLGGPTGVPEPASIALLGLGLAGIAALRRRA